MATVVGLHIDRSGRFGITHPSADLSLDAFTKAVKHAIHLTKRLALGGLVVVMPEVKGFPPPGVSERKDMVTQWATSARDEMISEWGTLSADSRIRLVIVAPANYIDRGRIGVALAAIRGLTANVFTTEHEAVDWLIGTTPPPLPRTGPSADPHRLHRHHPRHH